jgi:pilus assembly protein Flp/PilA
MKVRDRLAARRLAAKLWMADQGASMVEYALLVILIALVALVGVALAGSELSETYSEIASSVSGAGP